MPKDTFKVWVGGSPLASYAKREEAFKVANSIKKLGRREDVKVTRTTYGKRAR